MSRQPETVLVDKIRRVIKTAYPHAWVMKSVGGPYQTAGIPDLLVIVGGRLVGLEVKCPQPGETAEHARHRVTPRQEFQIQEIRKAGGTADVVVSPREALSIIQLALGTSRYHRVRTSNGGRPKKKIQATLDNDPEGA